MPYRTTCDPAYRDDCGAWCDQPCACGWRPTPDPAARSHPDAQTAQIAEES